MSNINLNNYEEFLLDLSEGNLSTSDVVALKAFLALHPELQIDLSDLSLPVLSGNEVVFDSSDELKKTIADYYEEQVFNYVEGNLNDVEKADLERQMLSDASLKNLLTAYQKTLLQKEDTVFTGKEMLLKTADQLILSDTAFAYVEGLLAAQERLNFEKEIKSDKTTAAGVNAYRNTKLIADKALVMPAKHKLKKSARIIYLFNTRSLLRTAAAIILLAGFGFIITLSFFDNTIKQVSEQNIVSKKLVKSADEKQPSLGNIAIAEQPMKENKVLAMSKVLKKSDAVTQEKNILVDKKDKTEPNVKPNISEGNTTAGDAQKSDSGSDLIAANTVTNEIVKPDTLSNSGRYIALSDLDVEDDLSEIINSDGKKGFWKRAVALAQKANKIGLKSIDGQEDDNQRYRLSFNSFSVEKK